MISVIKKQERYCKINLKEENKIKIPCLNYSATNPGTTHS